jgi:hypothetical protein
MELFRNFFADQQFLDYMVELLNIEKERKNFDWVESCERILAVLINCSVNTDAQQYLSKAGVFNHIEDISAMTYYSEEHKVVITRLLYLLSRLVSQPEILLKIVQSKTMLVRLFLYFNRDFVELVPHCLKIMFALFKFSITYDSKINNFVCNLLNLDPKNFVKEAYHFLSESMNTWNREKFINYSGLVSASLDTFPATSTLYVDLIPQLTEVLKDHVAMERKNAAVLLAKMARNEEIKKIMKKHHTMEVLMSLGGNLM